MVLQYILNQANQQRLLSGLRPEDLSGLKILRCYVVRALYVPQVIRTELTNNQAKKKRYNLSLVIIDQLTMTARALNQGGSTRWFNLAAAIRVESKKPTEFILPAMRKLFLSKIRIELTRPTFLMATPSPTKLLV